MKDDWRLRGQEAYLKGVELVRRKYRRYGNNPNWDHDHCEFCWVKFSVADSDSLNDGYATLDDYHWRKRPADSPRNPRPGNPDRKRRP